MHSTVVAFAVLNSVIFVTLAVLTILQWHRRRDAAAGWLAVTFLTLGLIVTVGRFVPSHPHGFVEGAVERVVIELLVLFPYLLYRFATVFAAPSVRLQWIVGSLTGGLTVWTFALPRIPAAGEHRPGWFIAYLVAFLVHWTVLSIVVALRLARAGRGQPSVASSRMRMLAFASALLTVAIIGVAFVSSDRSAAGAIVQALATLSGLAFLLGLAPPQLVRSMWRQPAQMELQGAIRELMTLATTREEVAGRVLPSIVAIVGARAAAILDGAGDTVAAEGLDPASREASEVVRVEAPGATLLLWTSPYAPFFGEDELRILYTLAALVGIALDRVRLFEQEHESRVALERANEVMTNFIALAAHELRTPVTAIHGFVQTLNHLGDRLSPEQQADVREALEQQTARMAQLVEQLLDLSRLDAEAIVVKPQPVDLRRRLEETVTAAAGAWRGEVHVEVPDPVDVLLDPAILDRIVTNLVTNAFRYGAPPVRVAVERFGGRLEISVEDAGPGVAAELEETLFERLRAPASRTTASRAPGSAWRSLARTRGPIAATSATTAAGGRARDS